MQLKSWRRRRNLVNWAAGGLLVLGGCGMTDQQLSSIWQSVITAGLNALVSNAVTNAVGGDITNGGTTTP
jgi:hypothetical protein